jgi:hypothetical protein
VDDTQFRAKVEAQAKRRGYRVTRDDWERAESEGLYSPYQDAFDTADVEEALAFFLEVAAPVNATPPRDWPDRSACVFSHYRDEQRLSFALFGLSKPLAWSRLEAFLTEIRDQEPAEGDRLFLDYATPDSEWRCILPIHKGFSTADAMAHLQEPEWIIARSNRLGRLWKTAQGIADETGCQVAQIVPFLLCNVTPLLPWLRVEATSRTTPAGVFRRFTIHVGTPDVTLDAVRDAYNLVRASALDGGDLRMARTRGRHEKRDRTAELLRFCAAMREQGSEWEQVFRDWNRKHPTWHYANTGSLKTSYSQAKRREATRRATQPVDSKGDD